MTRSRREPLRAIPETAEALHKILGDLLEERSRLLEMRGWADRPDHPSGGWAADRVANFELSLRAVDEVLKRIVDDAPWRYLSQGLRLEDDVLLASAAEEMTTILSAAKKRYRTEKALKAAIAKDRQVFGALVEFAWDYFQLVPPDARPAQASESDKVVPMMFTAAERINALLRGMPIEPPAGSSVAVHEDEAEAEEKAREVLHTLYGTTVHGAGPARAADLLVARVAGVDVNTVRKARRRFAPAGSARKMRRKTRAPGRLRPPPG